MRGCFAHVTKKEIEQSEKLSVGRKREVRMKRRVHG